MPIKSDSEEEVERGPSRRAKIVASVVGVLCVLLVFSPEIVSLLVRVPLWVSSQLPSISTPFGEVSVRSYSHADGTVVDISCVECEFESKLLAREPLVTDKAGVRGLYHGFEFKGRAYLHNVAAQIKAKWSSGAAHGSFDIPKTKINDAIQAIAPLVPEASKAKITGTFEGTGTFRWPNLILVFKPKVRDFTVAGLLDEATFRKGSFSFTAADGKAKRSSGEGTKNWLPIEKIGQPLTDAVITAEDIAFYSHKGYDLRGMLEAAKANEKSGQIKRGGSTISQQLAKNLFLTRERTYVRKVRELLYAVELENDLSKDRILELYLNIVEWGPGIHGAKAAAQAYFGKLPPALKPEEAAWIASILRSPNRAYRTQFAQGKASTSRAHWILRRMRSLSKDAREGALSRPIVFAKQKS